MSNISIKEVTELIKNMSEDELKKLINQAEQPISLNDFKRNYTILVREDDYAHRLKYLRDIWIAYKLDGQLLSFEVTEFIKNESRVLKDILKTKTYPCIQWVKKTGELGVI